MNFKSKLNSVRYLLGLAINLEQYKLLDGTIVEAEVFEVGYPLFVIDETGARSIAPEGNHETQEYKISVDAEGIITSIEEKEMETEEEVEVPSEDTVEVEVEMEGITEPVIPQLTPEDIQSLINGQIEPLYLVIEEMAKELTTIKESMVAMQEKYSKFSKAPAAEKIPTFDKTEKTIDPLDKRIERLNSLTNKNN
jgi:hypothetical protein